MAVSFSEVGRPVEAPLEASRLGAYEIVRKLARGGMAELFLAQTTGPEGFAKLVVLKKILPNYAENPKFVRLFLDEAKLVAQMDHPHIAHVYDMGKAGNDYFFAMEYVHGQDVRAIWRRSAKLQKPVPIGVAVKIAGNIAAALHYAHRRTRDDGTLLDIVHRDVSPSNILLSYDGAVKLVDFGVAKAATSSVKTRTGALKGKISYMSPEQAKGAAIDRRSDIFSLGIVLWEIVTGRRLYKAENDLATIQMIINSKPQLPSQVRSDCPAALDEIILRALNANVIDRYQSAEQMQLDLEALARSQSWDTSDSALRVYMNEIFEHELKIWHDAKSEGQTLIDHVAAQPTVILPLSESDVSDADGDDYELDDESESGMDSDLLTSAASSLTGLPPTTPRRVITDSDGHKTLTNEHEHDDATEMTSIPTAAMQAVGTATIQQVGVPTIQLSVPPPPVRAQTEPAPLSPNFGMGIPPAAFPVAPAEWRPRGVPAPVTPSSDERLTRHVLIACSVLFAVIVLIAVAFGGGAPSSAATPLMQPGGKVEMKTVPAK
jgi:serine/threonine protein kinase